jgi:deazaflavin-dependent oxidoreductase (nitroreductase family)
VTRGQRIRRSLALLLWKVINPPSRALAGIAPWWVVLETTGRRSGKPRQVPLARGPVDGPVTWMIAVHGEHSAYARNIAADPRVRLRLRGCWRNGTASLAPMDPEILKRFNLYARTGPVTMGIDPRLIRVKLD